MCIRDSRVSVAARDRRLAAGVERGGARDRRGDGAAQRGPELRRAARRADRVAGPPQGRERHGRAAPLRRLARRRPGCGAEVGAGGLGGQAAPRARDPAVRRGRRGDLRARPAAHSSPRVRRSGVRPDRRDHAAGTGGRGAHARRSIAMTAGWKWLLAIGGLLAANVISMVILAVMAHHGRAQVIPDYYARATHYDDELESASHSRALGWRVEVSATGDAIDARAVDAAGAPITGATVRITGYQRAYASDIVDIELASAGTGPH